MKKILIGLVTLIFVSQAMAAVSVGLGGDMRWQENSFGDQELNQYNALAIGYSLTEMVTLESELYYYSSSTTNGSFKVSYSQYGVTEWANIVLPEIWRLKFRLGPGLGFGMQRVSTSIGSSSAQDASDPEFHLGLQAGSTLRITDRIFADLAFRALEIESSGGVVSGRLLIGFNF